MIKNYVNVFKFSEIEIDPKVVFYNRKYVFAFVNLKPIQPGHVLLCPIRHERRYKDLTETECMELWVSVKNISENLKKLYNTDSINITIQDGKDAGQTVDHVHIHLIPVTKISKFSEIDNDERVPRTLEEMTNEAELYREKFVYV